MMKPAAPRNRNRRTPEFVVRRLRGPEWKAFRDLRLTALRSDPLAFGSSFTRESGYTPEKWKGWCRDGGTGGGSATFVAAGSSGTLVGMVGAFFAEETPQVWGMWTRPEWRNRGVGRRLVERLLAWLDKNRPGRPVILEVNPTQAAAVRIYASLGFRFNGVEESLGHDPPAIVRQMVRIRPPRNGRVPRPA
jgi:ribosomal protein S18 acetylase RimI-like enzyme